MDQDHTEQSLLFEGRIRCPWCETWDAEEAFVELQTPPNYPKQCGVVLKHGGEGGCKRVFSIRDYDRPAEAL